MEKFVYLVYDGSMKTIQTEQLHKYPALRMYQLSADEYEDLLLDLEGLYPKQELIVVKHKIENECELGSVVSAKIVRTGRHTKISNLDIALLVMACITAVALVVTAIISTIHNDTPNPQPTAEVIQND